MSKDIQNVMSRSATAMERAQETLREVAVILAHHGEHALLNRIVQERDQLWRMAEDAREVARDVFNARRAEMRATGAISLREVG